MHLHRLPFCMLEELLASAALCVAAHELINASCSINQLRLTGEERVRSVRDFNLDQGIGLTFEFDCLLGSAS